MIVADSSAWIEFLRGTGSPTHLRLRAALKEGGVASTDAIVMEVLAGAYDAADRVRLRRLLYGSEFIATEGPADYERAAEIYRRCRAGGETPRELFDCLIAAVAIRNDVEVLSSDTDFAVIARHSTLRLAAA